MSSFFKERLGHTFLLSPFVHKLRIKYSWYGNEYVASGVLWKALKCIEVKMFMLYGCPNHTICYTVIKTHFYSKHYATWMICFVS